MSKRALKLYLEDIISSIKNIGDYIKGMAFEEFIHDRKTVDAVVRNLEIIGQAARNIPQEVTVKYHDIPWREMVSMRNKVLHEYFGVDIEILWKTIQEDLPGLKEKIKGLPEVRGIKQE
ncbi:DUF86 domain-containing protein [Candidatus Gottesmanbacteria bacterium]|nr:DUF86 domain-containing protein [Candidatus Gottesmanbacteria bacterium]